MRILSKIKQVIACTVLLTVAQPGFAQLNILACEPEWAAMAKEIGGEHVNVKSATTHMQDPHQIQARPSLIAKARRADMIACTGAGLEVGWLPVLLSKSANRSIQAGKPGYFLATEHVPLIGKKSDDRTDLHAAGNPHVHHDPDRVLAIAEKMSKVMSDIDTSNANSYAENLQRFTADWKTAIQYWQQSAAALKGKSVIVHHDSWIYLLNWLGIQQTATLEPKHGVPPSSSHLAGLLKQLKSQSADMIIRSGYEDERPAQWLSDKTGIPIVSIPYSVRDYQARGALKTWMDNVVAKLLQGRD